MLKVYIKFTCRRILIRATVSCQHSAFVSYSVKCRSSSAHKKLPGWWCQTQQSVTWQSKGEPQVRFKVSPGGRSTSQVCWCHKCSVLEVSWDAGIEGADEFSELYIFYEESVSIQCQELIGDQSMCCVGKVTIRDSYLMYYSILTPYP